MANPAGLKLGVYSADCVWALNRFQFLCKCRLDYSISVSASRVRAELLCLNLVVTHIEAWSLCRYRFLLAPHEDRVCRSSQTWTHEMAEEVLVHYAIGIWHCVAFAFSWLLFLPCCVWSGPIWRHFGHSWWSRIPSARVLSCWAKHIQNGPQPNMCSMFTKSWARMFSLYKEKKYNLCLPIMVKVSFFFLNYKNPTQLLHHLLKPDTWPS